MKNLLLMAFLMIPVFGSAKSLNIKGVWKYKNIEMTFMKDTLTIDEVGNEGFVYTYKVDSIHNIVEASSIEYGDVLKFKVINADSRNLRIYYLDDNNREVFNFIKKKNQVPEMGF